MVAHLPDGIRRTSAQRILPAKEVCHYAVPNLFAFRQDPATGIRRFRRLRQGRIAAEAHRTRANELHAMGLWRHRPRTDDPPTRKANSNKGATMTAHTVRIKHAKLPPGPYNVQWFKAPPPFAHHLPPTCATRCYTWIKCQRLMQC